MKGDLSIMGNSTNSKGFRDENLSRQTTPDRVLNMLHALLL